ncbi:hypothetical protein Baya_10763 [Bagarius yarrelli]|uniref:Uncharacterized protein n=1 Tax=Bagarius yarrelli TaxID=175774 RepID=A0A556UZA4_BAGYA|nr:hypothetical protein Baya_10763 [Bagarius yarrelli]
MANKKTKKRKHVQELLTEEDDKLNIVSAEVKPHGIMNLSPVSSRPVNASRVIAAKECESFTQPSSGTGRGTWG